MDKKLIKKTYAARGLLDWQMALNVAGAIIRICFTGGSMGSNGVIPAKYTTDNPAMQAIIEKTRSFTSGKIYIYSSETLSVEKEKPEPPVIKDVKGKH
ncbi:MAG: hypothetical protein J1F16_05775 [Muribaculaceae bacterium]|nr:hypothetical protein [Muribaculaceae bacterium]